jgi:hypothetical protein
MPKGTNESSRDLCLSSRRRKDHRGGDLPPLLNENVVRRDRVRLRWERACGSGHGTSQRRSRSSDARGWGRKIDDGVRSARSRRMTPPRTLGLSGRRSHRVQNFERRLGVAEEGDRLLRQLLDGVPAPDDEQVRRGIHGVRRHEGLRSDVRGRLHPPEQRQFLVEEHVALMLHAADDEALARVPAGVGSADAAAREGGVRPRGSRARASLASPARRSHTHASMPLAPPFPKMSLSSMGFEAKVRASDPRWAHARAPSGALWLARASARRAKARAPRENA